MNKFKMIFTSSLIILMLSTSLIFAQSITPLAEADCPYGVHYMVRKGGATIRSTSGNLRYSEWATFQCSKCSAWFVCEGDPANYGTIGSYFVNPYLVQAYASVYVFETNATPSYKAYTPLSGFSFTRARIPVK